MSPQFEAGHTGQQPRRVDTKTTTPDPFAVEIKAKTRITDVIVQLTLVRVDGRDFPEWSPGSHIDLQLGPEMTRQYSLCGEQADRRSWQICVLHQPDGRGGSARVHRDLQEGDTLAVRGPRNNFELVPAERYLFIGGGIGITPLLSMIETVASVGAQWSLVYGGRSAQNMAFAEVLKSTYGDRVHLIPQDTDGLIDLPTVLSTADPSTAVYACGPESLLSAVETFASTADNISRVHVEHFAPRSLVDSPARDSFEVEFVQSGVSATIGPDASILDAAHAAGIMVPYSCSEGTCGTCETNIISGEADHRDAVLSVEEREKNSTLMICVSRAACPKLRLDI